MQTRKRETHPLRGVWERNDGADSAGNGETEVKKSGAVDPPILRAATLISCGPSIPADSYRNQLLRHEVAEYGGQLVLNSCGQAVGRITKEDLASFEEGGGMNFTPDCEGLGGFGGLDKWKSSARELFWCCWGTRNPVPICARLVHAIFWILLVVAVATISHKWTDRKLGPHECLRRVIVRTREMIFPTLFPGFFVGNSTSNQAPIVLEAREP